MRFVVIDWETFFDSKGGYTLKKMTTEAYVRDQRFEPHGCAVKWGPDVAARWYDARQAKHILQSEDWSDTCIIHHHAHFDSLIESHHYGIRPKLIGCTLSMARMMLGNHLSVSLDSVRKHYGMPSKTTPYHLFDGKRWSELDRAMQDEIAEGACDEVESIWVLFQRMLREGFPVEELELIDITIRMFTEPVLRADIDLLGKVWTSENIRKSGLLVELNVTEKQLQSSEQFAQLLVAEGVEPIKKKGKHGDIYAFAQTDEFMKDLIEDENPRVATLAQARLNFKSTIDQTRAERLGYMAQRGPLCVYIKYAGTHSLRDSGGDALNWQNFRRGSDIRKAVLAPEGYDLAVIDAKQIQCRMLNFLAGQDDIVQAFAEHRDIYAEAASKFYQRQVTKDSNPLERFVGKKIELGCGFGCGPGKFQATLRAGVDGPAVKLTDAEAKDAIQSYRQSHRQVTKYWHMADEMHNYLFGELECSWGPMTVRNKRVYLPNGTALIYDTLEWFREQDENGRYIGNDYWRYKTRRGWTKTYGAALVENAMQALERTYVMEAALRISRAGLRVVNREHDKLAILLPKNSEQQSMYEFCMNEMRRSVTWLPGCPLDAEGSLSERYE